VLRRMLGASSERRLGIRAETWVNPCEQAGSAQP
jgi:hypothetical protein